MCQLPNYTSNQNKSDRKGGVISVYIHKRIEFKTRPDLSVNNKDMEAVTMTILSNKRGI